MVPCHGVSEQGSALLTQKQILWVESLKTVYKTSPEPVMHAPNSSNRLRVKVYGLVTSEAFEIIVLVFILLNTVSLATFHDGQNAEWIRTFGVLEYLFTSIFSAGECVMTGRPSPCMLHLNHCGSTHMCEQQ